MIGFNDRESGPTAEDLSPQSPKVASLREYQRMKLPPPPGVDNSSSLAARGERPLPEERRGGYGLEQASPGPRLDLRPDRPPQVSATYNFRQEEAGRSEERRQLPREGRRPPFQPESGSRFSDFREAPREFRAGSTWGPEAGSQRYFPPQGRQGDDVVREQGRQAHPDRRFQQAAPVLAKHGFSREEIGRLQEIRHLPEGERRAVFQQEFGHKKEAFRAAQQELRQSAGSDQREELRSRELVKRGFSPEEISRINEIRQLPREQRAALYEREFGQKIQGHRPRT